MTFEASRRVFHEFRGALGRDGELQREFAAALEALLHDYHPSIPENRFVVGGAVEHILGAVMRASGIPVVNRGHAESGLDLRTHDAGFSVKATFQTGWADLRLINSLGSSAQRVWKEPTILVLGARGVGYVDPQLLPGATKSSGDALVLPGRAYREFLSAVPEYLCAVPVPLSPSNRQASKLASYAVAEEILGRIQFARLRRFRTSAT